MSAQGAASAGRNLEVDKAGWMREAKMFANIGLEIAKTLNGVDHSMTREWRERSDDPIKFFLKYRSPKVVLHRPSLI